MAATNAIPSPTELSPGEMLFSLLSATASQSEKIRTVESILDSHRAESFRDQMASWVLQFLPVEALVPETYAHWRPLVREAMSFMLARLSTSRLAPKLVEQIELPADTQPEIRLLKLIARVPGLQKLGQVLARNKHLPAPLRNALSELENGISDVNPDDVRQIIVSELGLQLDSYGVQIRPGLFSEASVSAVVRFTWANPETNRRQRGVFKVLKPYIPACFSEDMELLARLAKHLGAKSRAYGFAPHVLPDTFNDVRRLLQHEVNFSREQDTLVNAERLYSSIPYVRVPHVIQPLCTPKITAITEERGNKITDAVRRAPLWEQAQVSSRLVDALIAVPLFAPSGDAMFHADPHAGNLLYDRSRRELIILDWALTERLTRVDRRNLAMLFLMMFLRDPVGVGEAVMRLSPKGRRDRSKRQHVRESVTEYLNRLSAKKIPTAVDAMNLLEEIAWKGVRLPSSLIMFRKALFTLDGILHEIGAPDFSMESVMVRHILETWRGSWKTIGSPLTFGDWMQLQCSALLFPGRLGLQALQNTLERPPVIRTPA